MTAKKFLDAEVDFSGIIRVGGITPFEAGLGLVGYDDVGVGPPTTGTWDVGDFYADVNGQEWVCITAGTGTSAAWIIISGPDIAITTLAPAAALYETGSRTYSINAAYTATSGVLALQAIWLPAALPIGHIFFESSSQAASSPTHWWFGLFNQSRVMLANTADQTTAAFAAYAGKSLAIAKSAAGTVTSFTTTYSGLYYLGFCMTASTVCNLAECNAAATIGGVAPILFGTSSSEGAPPAYPFTASAISAVAGSSMYGYVAT